MISTLRSRIPFLVRVVIALAWLSAIILSFHLWSPSFLSVPIVSMGIFVTYLLLAAFVITLGVWVIRPTRRMSATVAVLAFLLCLGDVSRLQNWFYFYTLAVCLLSQESNKEETSFGPLWMLLAFLYFFAGVSKLNHSFYSSVAPALATQGLLPVFPFLKSTALFLVRLTPLFEIAAGVSLLFKRTRPYGIIIASSINISVVLIFGILSQAIGSVVWPWNTALALVSILAYLYSSPQIWKEYKIDKWKYALLSVVAIVAICRIFGLVPSPFGFAVWTGTAPRADIIIPYAAHELLKDKMSPMYQQTNGTYVLSLQEVAYTAFAVNIFPTVGTYRSVFKHLCSYTNNAPGMGMAVMYSDNSVSYRHCKPF